MTLDPQLVHRHAPGLRALVRELVLDDARVDDVLQETWLRALRESPQSPAAFGAWIRTVARRLAFRQRRSENRRRHHEGRLPPADEDLPRPDQIVERELARRQVVDAVLQLDEPYRTAILYRYLENRSAAEVAEHLGIPLETLRTRLKRGLTLLRGVLDRQHQGHAERWHRALLPLATLPLGPWSLAATAGGTASAASWLGGLWAGGQLLRASLLLLALGILGTTGWLAWSGQRTDSAVAPALVSFSADELAAVPAAGPGDEVGATRHALLHPTADAAPTLTAPTRRYRIEVSGRAVDLNRRPLRGVEVALFLRPAAEVALEALRDRGTRPDPAGLAGGQRPALLLPRTCTTGPDGRFRFVGPAYEETEIAVRLRHVDHAARSVEASWHHLEDGVEFGDVPLQSGSPLTGRVVDAEGAPCAGVAVSAHRARGRREHGPSLADDVVATTTTGLDGRFRFLHLPPASAVSLVAVDPRGARSATARADVSVEPGSVAPESVLVLPATHTVRCRFVWSDGLPATDLPVRVVPFDPALARVLFRGSGDDPLDAGLPAVLTDPAGAAELAVPTRSRWLLWVGATGSLDSLFGAPAPNTILGPFDSEGPAGPLTLDRGWTVVGRLTSAAGPGDGSLPERVLLTPRRGLRGLASVEARVADDGSFRFEGVRTSGFGRSGADVWELALPDARHRFAAEQPPRIEIPDSTAARAPFQIAPAEIATVAPLRLRLLAADGRPLAGAELSWSGSAPRRRTSGDPGSRPTPWILAADAGVVVTDTEGRAALPRRPVSTATLAVRRSDGVRTDILLELPEPMAGKTAGADGSAAGDNPAEDSSAPEASALEASAPGASAPEDAAPGELVVRFPPTTTLVGKVIGLGNDDRALVRAVHLDSAASVARPVRGGAARFQFDALPSGSYALWLEPRDAAPATRLAVLELAGAEVETTLDAREARHGRIAGVLHQVGVPADARIRVRFVPRSERPWLVTAPAAVAPDADGRFEIDRLPPGPGLLTVTLDRSGARRPTVIHSEPLTIDANRIHDLAVTVAVAELAILPMDEPSTGEPAEASRRDPRRRGGSSLWILRDVLDELPDLGVEPGDQLLLPAREWLLVGVDGQTAGAVALLPGSRSELRLPIRPEPNNRDAERRPSPEAASRRESR